MKAVRAPWGEAGSHVSEAPELTDALRMGRRALDGGADVDLLADIQWHPEAQCWVLPLRLRANTEGSTIPEWTPWHVLVDASYPLGDIDVHPSKQGGIEETRPHQNLNRRGPETRPWRDGKLCLQTGLAALGLRARDEEPLDAASRLGWHVARAREWLEAAARGRLLPNGAPFELPALPHMDSTQVVFREDAESLATWERIEETQGWVELAPLPGNPRVFAATAFYTIDGRWLFSFEWGDLLRRVHKRRRFRVPWLRCRQIPVLPPYAPPVLWTELEAAAHQLEWSLRDALHGLATRLRDGERHLCLLGFPIPETQGAPSARLHWWAMRLPRFAYRDIAPRGFRRTEQNYWRHDQAVMFQRSLPIDWIRTDNWAPSDLRSRGALPEALRGRWVALLGAGSLGSSVAELLVRGGVSRLVILDGDDLEAGNLVRHSLDLGSVRYSKAHALAARLRNLNPDLRAQSFRQTLRVGGLPLPELVGQCETIIDCTASDEVIEVLGRLSPSVSCHFFSASFGVGARRLLCFNAMGDRFPSDAYWAQAQEWIRRDHEEIRRTVLPREGVGCWHPVFPARSDDVVLAAAIAVKSLVAAVTERPAARLDVYERDEQGVCFRGVRHVSLHDSHAAP
ncbi:ThiF family adenylyltransferase [Myxococcus xanthus]|nr:hypothetical protein MyxoNM_37590 [Myxococcus xanthus]SDW05001.1 ThiF family protein [Myxococcus xanthus]